MLLFHLQAPVLAQQWNHLQTYVELQLHSIGMPPVQTFAVASADAPRLDRKEVPAASDNGYVQDDSKVRSSIVVRRFQTTIRSDSHQ